MSSKPEEGEDGVTEDTIDLPGEPPEIGGLTNGSEVQENQGPDLEDDIGVTEHTAVLESIDRDDVANGQDGEFVVNEEGTTNQRRNLRDDLHSDEEAISIPDDSPSIQVRGRSLKGLASTNARRVLHSRPREVKHFHF